MKTIGFDVRSAEDARRIISECEAAFSAEIDRAVAFLFGEGDVKTIALSGPTCSGKTTTAEKLTRRIERTGKKTVVLSFDDFFLDRDSRNVVEGESPDYDSAAALDLDYLEYFMKRLDAGLPVLVPHYDFTVPGRTGYDEYYPSSDDIYVFEGIQAVYPEVTRLFGDGFRSVFMNVKQDVSRGDAVIGRDELRLLRRTIRDSRFRGATPEFTLHLWEGVRANELKNIFPNARGCDLTVDSFLDYEPFFLSRFCVPLLETVPEDSRYRSGADELREKLMQFECPYFETSMIPKYSVFREFVG